MNHWSTAHAAGSADHRVQAAAIHAISDPVVSRALDCHQELAQEGHELKLPGWTEVADELVLGRWAAPDWPLTIRLDHLLSIW